MKKYIAFFLVVLMVVTSVLPAFAYIPCRCENCKGRLSYQYGSWSFAYKVTKYENGRYVWKFYDVRTVTEKCSENSSHNCRYNEYKCVKTEYAN